MKKPSKKQICILLVFFSLALNSHFRSKFMHADNHEMFSTCKIEKIKNFKACCDKIFKIVAKKLKIEVNENIPRPTVLTDNQLTLVQFNRYLGWDADQLLPYYFHKKNIIVIPCYCRLDSLAHEFVHYFQAKYQNQNFDCTDGMSAEQREAEAILTQRWFKTNFMKPRFP